MAGSSGRHPPSSVTAATAASIGHKSRAFTGGVEDAKTPVVDSDGENKKPTASSPAKRVIGVSPSVSKATGPRNTMSSTNRRSTIESSKVTERRNLATRSGATSPTKGAPKAAIGSRPTILSSAPRTTRLPPGSSRLPPRAMTSETTRKRLNTISASPAAPKAQLGVSDSVTADHRTPVKPVRPGLVTRMSTMSITIEQRLREMELVSDMLQAAMAEDGDEDDEVKEEYGKKMDETLASLRVKLEEAKRNEGKHHVSASGSNPDSGVSDGISTAVKAEPYSDIGIPDGIPTVVKVEPVSGDLNHDDPEALRSELAASQAKISSLEAEIDVMKTQLLDFSIASQDASEKIQQTTENIRQEHVAELERLSANHLGELKAVRARLAEAEAQEKRISEQSLRDLEEVKRVAMDQGSKGTAALLDAQKKSQEDALKALEEELTSEKSNGVDTASKLQNYVSEISALHIQLDEERQRSEDQLQEVKKRFRAMIEKKDDWINSKKREMSSIEDMLAEERILHVRELKEASLGYELRIKELEDKLVACDCRILELKDEAEVAMASHGSVLQAKQHEIQSLGQVIENLQDQVQDIQQHKEQGLDTAKVQMVQEHQSTLQKLITEHELGLKRSQDEAVERVAELTADHEHEITRLCQANEEAQQDHEVALAELLVSKNELHQELQTRKKQNESLLSDRQELEKAISELRDQVIQGRKALADADSELQAVREAQSNTHTKEKTENERELDKLRTELKTAKSDAARDKETIDKLAATAQEVQKSAPDSSESDQLREEISGLTKRHATEISRIQETLRTENEKRNVERKQGAEVRDRLANELRELESVRKELPSVREEAERYRMAAELARLEIHEMDSRLQQALAASQDHEATHRDLSVEVDKLRAELANLRTKPAGSKGHSKKLSNHSHELEALQIMADKEREYTDKLKKQLDEATAAADRHATRVREVEAALKVTTAELTEMRTRRANGQEFTTSPAPKGRLRTSRWISESSQENHAMEPDWSGVDLGPHIEGTMAGLQEQIRQIEGVHEDMLDDQKRMVNMLSKVTDRKADSPLRSPLSGRANR